MRSALARAKEWTGGGGRKGAPCVGGVLRVGDESSMGLWVMLCCWPRLEGEGVAGGREVRDAGGGAYTKGRMVFLSRGVELHGALCAVST